MRAWSEKDENESKPESKGERKEEEDSIQSAGDDDGSITSTNGVIQHSPLFTSAAHCNSDHPPN
jgi:hypothetical protein